MSAIPDPYAPDPVQATPKKRSFWQKLGGGSLSVSLILHGILLAIGVVWVLRIIPPPPEKVVDFMPASGGGGSPASQQKAQQQRVQMMQPNMARVAAVGASSTLVLPEPDEVSQMSSMGSLSSGGLSAGLGGSGAGGGKGVGNGPGVGSGLAPGMSDGTGSKNPFGVVDPNANAFQGTFYDLKQNERRRPTKIGELKTTDEIVPATREALHDFVKGDWSAKSLDSKYFKAPQTLYQTKFFMPRMSASEAPKAFGCEKEVKPSRWVVVYRGVVRPPASGRYRFVGAGDDSLVVRFNGKVVFDYGWDLPSGNISVRGHSDQVFKGVKDREWDRLRKDWAMPDPVEVRPQGPAQMVKSIGGMGVGERFEAKADTDYPIEILISEIPGGSFAAFLLIEDTGARYKKDGKGSPILPVFRVDPGLPAKGEAPPYDPNGPVWKLVPGATKREI